MERDSRPGGSVLIVEDDASNRDVLRIILEEEGYWCAAVGSAEAALVELGRRSTDLVLLDYRLPGMGAPALAEALRTHKRRPPILLTTTDPDAKTPAKALGAEGWLAKPFQIEDLLAE